MSKDNIKFERVYEKPIKIFGKQLKIIRVILIASALIVYTGFLFYETKSITPLIFGSFGIVLLAAAILLMKKRILYIKDFNLECSSAGDVYITKLKGICPKCKGELKIKGKFIQCCEDKNHTWDLSIIEKG